MRLAGEANWWLPAPLRRLYERFGISEGGELDEPAPALMPMPLPATVAVGGASGGHGRSELVGVRE
jgi:hypothetical protein